MHNTLYVEVYMKINWFPGHMNKALKDIAEQLKKVDVVIYILDSRIPISSLNPSLSDLTQNKPVLYVFNKIDIADRNKITAILPKFKSKTSDYILFNSTLSGKSDLILNKVKGLAKEKIERYKKKGVKPSIRTMVVGIPNCGKSTLVNNLCKKAKTVTGNRAGITKHGLWLPIGDCIEVYDTPGTLYPNIADQDIAKKLAFVGSVNDDILDFVDLANVLLEMLNTLYPEKVKDRYSGENTLEGVAKVRKYLTNGGEIDIERTAKSVIDDFRKGRLGNLTLD